jgi:hypothetical protein
MLVSMGLFIILASVFVLLTILLAIFLYPDTRDMIETLAVATAAALTFLSLWLCNHIAFVLCFVACISVSASNRFLQIGLSIAFVFGASA